MSFLSRLLASLLQINLDDDQPASCLQPVLAWKERVVEHQEFSVSSLNMLAIETCQKEQEKLGEHNRVDDQANNSLQQKQEQDKPDQLVKGGQRKGKEKGDLQIPSLQPTEARGSLTSFPTVRAELAETSQKKQKGKAKSQTLA